MATGGSKRCTKQVHTLPAGPHEGAVGGGCDKHDCSALGATSSSVTSRRVAAVDVPRAPWEKSSAVGAEAEKARRAEDEAMDYLNMAPIILGMLGYFFKWKIASWLALFACLSSMARMRTAEIEIKQVFGPFLFAVMGIVNNHLARG